MPAFLGCTTNPETLHTVGVRETADSVKNGEFGKAIFMIFELVLMFANLAVTADIAASSEVDSSSASTTSAIRAIDPLKSTGSEPIVTVALSLVEVLGKKSIFI